MRNLFLMWLLASFAWMMVTTVVEARKNQWIELPGYIIESRSVEAFLPFPVPKGRKPGYRFNVWREDVDKKLDGEVDCETGAIKIEDKNWQRPNIASESNEATMWQHFCK